VAATAGFLQSTFFEELVCVLHNIINFYDSFKKNTVQYLLYIKIDNKIFCYQLNLLLIC